MGAGMFWRRFRVASDRPCDPVQSHRLATLHAASNRHQRPHCGHAVIHRRAVLGLAVQDGVGEAFNLEFVSVGVLAEWTMKLAVLLRETFDHTGLVIPRQEDLSLHAAVLAVNLKTLLEIA